VQGLDSLAEGVIIMQVSQVRPIHTIFDLLLFLNLHLPRTPLIFSQGVIQALMEGDLALGSVAHHWPRELPNLRFGFRLRPARREPLLRVH